MFDTRGRHLTAAQERRLAAAAARGDRAARNVLAQQYAGLARHLARVQHRRSPQLTLDDLRQDAHEALLQALGRYDPHRGTPPAAWAAQQIRWTLADRSRAARSRPRMTYRDDIADLRAAGQDTDPHHQAVAAERRRRLLVAVSGLTRVQQAAVLSDRPLHAGVSSRQMHAARQRALRALASHPQLTADML